MTKMCVRCGRQTSVDVVARCAACDGPLVRLEPLPIECGFCGTSNPWYGGASCADCRGPLPSVPGSDPGPRPPDPPRVLPAGYDMRVRYWKNNEVLIGIFFTVVLCWSVLFPIIGIPLWIIGHRSARARLRVLTTGTAARGRVKSITVVETDGTDLEHPLRIEYELETPTGACTGSFTSEDRASRVRSVGDVLWVLYDPERPRESAIWPPIH